jgi:hypothetical protein
MVHLTYHIVEHDGGWAYQVDGTYSETFRSRDQARAAAHRAALEQQVGGQTAGILYEDRNGQWREEVADGGDRPETEVEG